MTVFPLLRDEGLLLSALARPQASAFGEDAALLHSLSHNRNEVAQNQHQISEIAQWLREHSQLIELDDK